MVIHTFAEINANRKKLRRLFLLVSVPILLAALLFSFKVYTLYSNTDDAIEQYANKNYADSEQSANKQKEVNFMESWRAYYNAGTAVAQDGDLNKAQINLETALGLVSPGLNECAVRANLALVYEKQGDTASAAGDEVTKTNKYAIAQTTIEEAPAECTPPPPPNSPDDPTGENERGAGDGSADELEKASDRLNEKINGSPDPSSPNTMPGSPSADQEEGREQIEEQIDQSAKDRANQEAKERGESGGLPDSGPGSEPGESGNSGVEKPW